MPINYKEYPPEWKEIRERILKRADDCCEFCGLPNYEEGYRIMIQNENGKWIWLEGVLCFNPRHFKEKYYRKQILLDGSSAYFVQNLKVSKRKTKIILTIAHLDHDKENWEIKDGRLAALCQLCHLMYDVGHKSEKRKRTKHEKSIHDPGIFLD